MRLDVPFKDVKTQFYNLVRAQINLAREKQKGGEAGASGKDMSVLRPKDPAGQKQNHHVFLKKLKIVSKHDLNKSD